MFRHICSYISRNFYHRSFGIHVWISLRCNMFTRMLQTTENEFHSNIAKSHQILHSSSSKLVCTQNPETPENTNSTTMMIIVRPSELFRKLV